MKVDRSYSGKMARIKKKLSAKEVAYKKGKKEGHGWWQATKDALHTASEFGKTTLKAAPFLAIAGGGAYGGYKLAEAIGKKQQTEKKQ